MTYELEFDPRALKEWRKLGDTVKAQFKKKLASVLVNPRNESARLHDLPDCYKIKLKSSGYRLVYQVRDAWLLFLSFPLESERNPLRIRPRANGFSAQRKWCTT